jgi:TPR repeat protein
MAEQGVDIFQYLLGLAYEQGKEVPQDYSEAVRWYRLAADQGRSNAQRRLGYMYFRGRGVPRDLIHAHMWLNLSAAQGDTIAQEGRDMVAQRMTSVQIAEAQRLAREWKPK